MRSFYQVKLKQRIYHILEKGSHGKKVNRIFDYFIMVLILLSIVTIILESIPELSSQQSSLLRYFNLFTIMVFTIEYVLRIYVSELSHPSNNRIKSAFKFIFSGYGLIDLLAIIPFYLPMLVKMDLRFLRVLRLTRFLRILKVNRYNSSLNIIVAVLREKRYELAITGFFTFMILLLASFIMYYVEGETQPEQFPNILASFWWAVATLTTVGYGDVYPITVLGKIVSGLIAITGIGLVALPTGIISAGFMNKIEKRKKAEKVKKCPHCGENLNG